jgi:D-threonate/D-erythronate kinase
MKQRCLVIADDLTGAADSGAQFAKNGFNTFLISPRDWISIDFSKFIDREVLVVNTDSRRLRPVDAIHLVADLSKRVDRKLFPIIYKKIDSTLRGNIGQEIDAILKETGFSGCIVAPAYPEQNRTMIDGIMMVEGKPISWTEFAGALPVQTSDARNLLERQSACSVGIIALPHVNSGKKHLQERIEEEQGRGNKIVIVDAVQRQDLTNIAEAVFRMSQIPLLVGSAGLAEEIAKKLSFSRKDGVPFAIRKWTSKDFKYIFIISGSRSHVTHEQLKRVEERWGCPCFEMSKLLLTSDEKEWSNQLRSLIDKIITALKRRQAVLKTCPEGITISKSGHAADQSRIKNRLAEAAYAVMEAFRMHLQDLVIIAIGGDTAMSVFSSLGFEGIEIEGEMIEGIMRGHLVGGLWHGLRVVTKAGAFGMEDALDKILCVLNAPSNPGGSSH